MRSLLPVLAACLLPLVAAPLLAVDSYNVVWDSPSKDVNGTFTCTLCKRSLSGMDFTVWTATELAAWTDDTGASQSATAIPDSDKESGDVTLSPELSFEEKTFVRISALAS